MARPCDGKCNECPIIGHPNSRMLTHVLNKIRDRFGVEVHQIIQDECSNMTVCYDCRYDDFCHLDGCALVDDRMYSHKRQTKKGDVR